jgi:hypothetical protein
MSECMCIGGAEAPSGRRVHPRRSVAHLVELWHPHRDGREECFGEEPIECECTVRVRKCDSGAVRGGGGGTAPSRRESERDSLNPNTNTTFKSQTIAAKHTIKNCYLAFAVV